MEITDLFALQRRLQCHYYLQVTDRRNQNCFNISEDAKVLPEITKIHFEYIMSRMF